MLAKRYFHFKNARPVKNKLICFVIFGNAHIIWVFGTREKEDMMLKKMFLNLLQEIPFAIKQALQDKKVRSEKEEKF